MLGEVSSMITLESNLAIKNVPTCIRAQQFHSQLHIFQYHHSVILLKKKTNSSGSQGCFMKPSKTKTKFTSTPNSFRQLGEKK